MPPEDAWQNASIEQFQQAAFLWEKAAEGEFDAGSLCKALCAEYEVAPEQAMTDVTNTIASWKEAGVIS